MTIAACRQSTCVGSEGIGKADSNAAAIANVADTRTSETAIGGTLSDCPRARGKRTTASRLACDVDTSF